MAHEAILTEPGKAAQRLVAEWLQELDEEGCMHREEMIVSLRDAFLERDMWWSALMKTLWYDEDKPPKGGNGPAGQ